ncbi:MAG: dTMP kinase [Holosporales bacterium]|jgi:dTMP kinase|nr:dTMP kinase [Holosporales bacterium]
MNCAARGQFITFEGGEGTGKSTQIQRAAAYLRAQNIPVEVVREPGGTPEGEVLRDLWKNPPCATLWDPPTEAFLLFTARRILLCRVIWPCIQQGTWVLCDRFYDSTLVYQGMLGGADIEKLMQLKYLTMGDFEPDLTLLFDVPTSTALQRLAQRKDARHDGVVRYDTMAREQHEKVRQAYLRLAEIFSFRVRLVKARASADAVAQAVQAILATHKEALCAL